MKRSLYGLKQSSRCWNQALSDFLESLGFKKSDADPCIYVLVDPLIIIAVYVDDLILAALSSSELAKIKEELSQKFDIKDLGNLHYIIGISVYQSSDIVMISQRNYVEEILERFGMSECNPVSTPMDLNVSLKYDDGSCEVDRVLYQSMVGSLLYLAIATRPDISQAVALVSRYNSDPNKVI